MPRPDELQRALQGVLPDVTVRAHVPYSNEPRACVIVLSDGALIPGSRVESASFSLTIPELINAFSTAAALGRHDVVALVSSSDLRDEDAAFLAHTFAGSFDLIGARIAVLPGAPLPKPGDFLEPFMAIDSGMLRMEAARRLTDRAVVPQSDFPVACVAMLPDGRALPGVNVEHADWSRIICAERNALGTLISYGLGLPESIYLTCSRDDGCTPCGACRQLLAELTPSIHIIMDRGDAGPLHSTPADLLPHFFSGRSVERRS